MDISVAIENDVPADPPGHAPRVAYRTHEGTAAEIAAYFPGLSPSDLPGGLGWAVETVELETHNGTHVDAPWHYHPTMNGGERAWSIDEVPLDWFFRPAIKLDLRHLPDGHVVSVDDLNAAFAAVGREPEPMEIVLVNTSAGARYGSPDYVASGCGFGRDATLHLTGLGVRVVGTDGWSWDAPFASTARRYARTRDSSIIWEGHKAGMEQAYCQIEKLHGLDRLPASGFQVICFPTRIASASAGWTRAVALLED